MATSTQTPQQELDNVIIERETVVFGFDIIPQKDDDGKVIAGKFDYVPAVYGKEKADKLEAAGKFTAPEEKNAGVIDVVTRYPKTLDALIALCDTPEKQQEALNNHNRGASTKVNNRMKAKVLALNDDGTFALSEKDVPNGVLDLTDEILSESKRKVLTPEERLDRFCKDNNISDTVKAAMRDAWLASNQ